jgi:uncharacterized protein HemY
MKTTTVTLVIFLFLSAFTGKDGNYEKAMLKNIAALHEAQSVEAMQEVAHAFERIAQAETSEWLPRYYAAYAYITAGAMTEEKEKKDSYLDQAQIFVDEAMQLKQNESELVALQGYLHMIRVSADPATRGQELAPKATQILAKAAEMNPENPRALMLLGQMQFGTAQFFGTDVKEPCTLISKSIALYEKQEQAENTLMPTWGVYIAKAYQSSCNH